MTKPAMNLPIYPPTRGSRRDCTGRTWPGLPARPARHRRGRHAARDLHLRLLIAVGFGAATALILFGLFVAVAA